MFLRGWNFLTYFVNEVTEAQRDEENLLKVTQLVYQN